MTDDPAADRDQPPVPDPAGTDLFRKVFEHSNDAIFVFDPDADAIRVANPQACRMLDYDRETLLEMGPSDIHPDELAAFRAFVEDVREEGTGWTDELTCLTRSGDRLPVEVSASVIEYEGASQLLAIVRDVSDRIRQRDRLAALVRASRQLARVESVEEIATITVGIAEDVLDQPLTAFWRYDGTADRLVPVAYTDEVDALAAQASDWEPVELPPGTVEMAVFRAGEPRLIEDYQTLENRAADAPLRTILMLPIGDHGVLHIGDTAPREFDEAERDLAELLAKEAEAALDRAERERRLRERERELERQNDRLQEFAGIVAHDLRNPLNVIAGRAELARATGDAEHFDAIDRATDRMEALIDDTLRLARQGAVIDETTTVAIDAVARSAWETVDRPSGDLTTRDPPTVEADRDRLHELLANLFRNAVEHGGNGVTVRVGALDDAAGFYVADDGPGIPEGDREAVFETGYSTAESGTGFGLAIVEEIAEAHGWTVTVAESRAGGARFEFAGVDLADPE